MDKKRFIFLLFLFLTLFSISCTNRNTEVVPESMFVDEDIIDGYSGDYTAYFDDAVSAEYINENKRIVLDKSSENEAVLYGVGDHQSMVLSLNNVEYTINRTWNDRFLSPMLLCIDIYEDESIEYGIVNQFDIGTECNSFSLTIIELINGELIERCFIENNEMWMTFYAEMSIEYFSESSTAIVYVSESKLCEVVVKEASEYYQPTGLGFGDIYGYTLIDGKIYHWINVGFLYSDRVTPCYESSFVLIAPILIDEKKNITLGGFEIYDGDYYDLIYGSV